MAKKNKALNVTIEIWAAIFLLVAFGLFFSPLLISFLTNVWWYMFLFFVSWIPSATVIVVGNEILDYLKNGY